MWAVKLDSLKSLGIRFGVGIVADDDSIALALGFWRVQFKKNYGLVTTHKNSKGNTVYAARNDKGQFKALSFDPYEL